LKQHFTELEAEKAELEARNTESKSLLRRKPGLFEEEGSHNEMLASPPNSVIPMNL
jgi:hypothetical protein